MIEKYQRDNVLALVAQEYPPLLDIIAEHKNGVDVSEALEAWQGYGTTGEAIAEYLETLKADKPKRKRSAKTKKDTPPTLEK